MISLSGILFLQVSIFLISSKIFNKFTDLFGEKTKINLKVNKKNYLIIGYFTSVYVFVRGFRLNENESIDPYTIYISIFLIVILIPLNILLKKIKNTNLKYFISTLAGLLLALVLFWAAILASV